MVLLAFASAAHAQSVMPGAQPDPEPTTPDPMSGKLAWAAGADVTHATTALANAWGSTVFGEIGVHIDSTTTVGLHADVGVLSGSYTPELTAYRATLVPIDFGGFASATAYDRFWAKIFLGVHIDGVSLDMDSADSGFSASFGLQLAGGADIIKLGAQRLGIYLALQTSFDSDVGYVGVGGGVQVRH
jgi:hypothetical protein